ncbi:hypothetical protein D9M71_533930 [compost metagenome]
MHAATGQLLNLLHRVAVFRVDHVGGAELLGQLQLGVEHIDGDDARRTGQCRAIDRGKADAATTEHRDRFAGAHLGGIEDCASAGGDCTTQQRGTVQGHVAADSDQGVLVHQHLLGIGRQVNELRHRLLHIGQARLFVFATLGFGRDAQRQVAGDAVFTMAAVGRQAGHHMVARLDRTHQRTHLFDDARGLMAQDHRRRVRIMTIDKMQVRMTDTNRDRAYQYFARTGFADTHFFNGQG